MHDSGKRKEQTTGALSDPSHGIIAMELLSPYSLWDLASWLGEGAKKYAPRNWEQGIPFSVCVGKAQRHLQQYLMGKTDENHLNAIGFWWHALAHYRKMIELELLPKELDDLPKYEQQQDKFVCSEDWEIDHESLDGDCGWYIINKNIKRHLQKDLQVHEGTGYKIYHGYGNSPGYWPTKEAAEDCLKQYLES